MFRYTEISSHHYSSFAFNAILSMYICQNNGTADGVRNTENVAKLLTESYILYWSSQQNFGIYKQNPGKVSVTALHIYYLEWNDYKKVTWLSYVSLLQCDVLPYYLHHSTVLNHSNFHFYQVIVCFLLQNKVLQEYMDIRRRKQEEDRENYKPKIWCFAVNS
jgi:hypothetical protein